MSSPPGDRAKPLKSKTGKGVLISACTGLVDCAPGSTKSLQQTYLLLSLCEILPTTGAQCSKQLMLNWGPHTPKTHHFPKEISVIVGIFYVCSVHTLLATENLQSG